MSTGPGRTRKADGSSDASVDDIADLLVEEGAAAKQAHPQIEQALDDSLDVMLETPGPVAVSTFLPPPPSLPHVTDDNSSETEDRENAEETSGESNLAYEDLLAKLVLPANKPAEPEPSLPAPAAESVSIHAPTPAPVSMPASMAAPTPLPVPEALAAPLPAEPEPLSTPTPAPMAFMRPSASIPVASASTDERTLVTENPLLAEEQQAAAREGRTTTSRDQAPRVQEEFRPAVTEPMPRIFAGAAAAKSKTMFVFAGGFLAGVIVTVLAYKIFVQAPVTPPVVVAPAAVPLPPPPPPAKVEPLPSTPPAAAAPVAAPAAAAPAPAPEPAAAAEAPAENPTGADEASDGAKAAPKTHKPAAVHKVVHTPKPVAVAPAPKPAPVAKAAPAPAAKPAKAAAPAAAKKKGGGYADPFDN